MEHCPNCRSTDLFEMDLTVAGVPLHFSHCRACEHRWWRGPDRTDPLVLDDLLAS